MIRVLTSFSNEIAELPTVAIDLSAAYTAKKEGTGFGFQCKKSSRIVGRNLTQTNSFTRTIKAFQKLQKAGLNETNLILEAPLSGAVSSSEAFLDARLRALEVPAHYPGLRLKANQSRPWNSNAGASTALMALMFLREIADKMPGKFVVNLFEGFWSWGTKPKQHHLVATGLIESLRLGCNRIVKLPSGGASYVTALQILKIEAENQGEPPLVVFGNPDLAEAYEPAH